MHEVISARVIDTVRATVYGKDSGWVLVEGNQKAYWSESGEYMDSIHRVSRVCSSSSRNPLDPANLLHFH